MSLWSGIGNYLEENKSDLLVGAVSVAGFAVGGPLGAAVAGGIAGGVANHLKGENVLLGVGLGAAGALVGGLGGAAFRGAARGLLGQSRALAIAAGRTGPGAEKIAFNRSGLFLKTIPERLGGAHAAPWKTYMGLIGAGTGAQFALVQIPEKYHNWFGYPDIPLIDISEEELDSIPDDMPHIMMPDPSRLPNGLELSAPMEANYRTVPVPYAEYWKSFGEKLGKLDLPKELEVSDISGEEKARIANYQELVDGMRARYENLRTKASVVAEANSRTIELCNAGRSDFSGVLTAWKAFAESDPRDAKRIGILTSEYAEKVNELSGLPVFQWDPTPLSAGPPSEDMYALVLIAAAYDNADTIITAYAEEFEALGAKTESGKPETEQGGQKTGIPQNTYPGTSTDPYYTPPGNQTGSTPQTTPPRVAGRTPWDLAGGAGSRSPKRSVTDDPTKLDSVADRLGSAAGIPDSAAAAAAATPPVSAAGNGMGSALQSMMLPQLMQAMMGNRQGARDDRERERHARREWRDDEAPVAGMPAPAAPNVPAAPAPSQPTAAPTGEGKTVSARSDSGPPPGKPMPASVSDGKGNVMYTFPDGRTQEVSAVVARALDAAIGNAAATDAQAAYKGTAAEWKEPEQTEHRADPKQIGRRIDPNETMTGDVGAWAERTALLIRFDGQEQLEAVVDGALVPVTELSQMQDGAGEFGGFVGIFHPPGIEKVAAEAAVSAPPVDQAGPDLVVTA